MQTCTKCKAEKVLHEFSKQRTKTSGYSSWCKSCFSEYSNRRFLENKEKLLADQKKYREGLSLERKAEVAAYQANYYREVDFERRKTNKPVLKIHQHNCKAKARGIPGRLSRDIVIKLLVSQGNCCAACTLPLTEDFDIDHIVPTSKGGLNIDSNIQLLHPICNGKKHAMTNEEFLQRLNQK